MTDREFTRRLLQTVATVIAVGIVLVALYAARAALMLIYISALIAMGFAPVVNVLQRRRSGAHRPAAAATPSRRSSAPSRA